MKKTLLTLILSLTAVFMLSGCFFNLDGTKITYKDNSGNDTEGYGFDSMDQLKSSLLYIANEEYGNFTIGGYDADFDKWLSETTFTYEHTEYVAAETYSETGYKIIARPDKYFHETSSTNYGYYTQKKGYYTGAVAIYVWSEEAKRYSDGNYFDFGCDVK